MDNQVAALLDRAQEAVYQAQQCLYVQRQKASIRIPELYPGIGSLVELGEAICEFLETVPDLRAFDPSKHYDSRGLEPRDSMASAEATLSTARALAEALDLVLNKPWSEIGRLGVKDD